MPGHYCRKLPYCLIPYTAGMVRSDPPADSKNKYSGSAVPPQVLYFNFKLLTGYRRLSTLNSALLTVALLSRTPAAASASGSGWTTRPVRDLSTSIAHHRYVPTYNGYLLPGHVARGNLLMHSSWFLRLALCKLIEHVKLTDRHTSPK
jgi:hypothetical protein